MQFVGHTDPSLTKHYSGGVDVDPDYLLLQNKGRDDNETEPARNQNNKQVSRTKR